MRFLKLSAYGIAALFDVSLGLFLLACFSTMLSYQASLLDYLIAGFLGVAPDLDFFLLLFKKKSGGKIITHHEYPTHWPLVGIPLAIVLGWFLGEYFWAIVSGVIILCHYLHDTRGLLEKEGNGIAWLKPFSNKYYGFDKGKLIVYSLEQLQEGVHTEKQTYLGGFYYRWLSPSHQATLETGLACIMLAFTAVKLFGLLGLLIPTIAMACILAVWQLSEKFFFNHQSP